MCCCCFFFVFHFRKSQSGRFLLLFIYFSLLTHLRRVLSSFSNKDENSFVFNFPLAPSCACWLAGWLAQRISTVWSTSHTFIIFRLGLHFINELCFIVLLSTYRDVTFQIWPFQESLWRGLGDWLESTFPNLLCSRPFRANSFFFFWHVFFITHFSACVCVFFSTHHNVVIVKRRHTVRFFAT